MPRAATHTLFVVVADDDADAAVFACKGAGLRHGRTALQGPDLRVRPRRQRHPGDGGVCDVDDARARPGAILLFICFFRR